MKNIYLYDEVGNYCIKDYNYCSLLHIIEEKLVESEDGDGQKDIRA